MEAVCFVESTELSMRFYWFSISTELWGFRSYFITGKRRAHYSHTALTQWHCHSSVLFIPATRCSILLNDRCHRSDKPSSSVLVNEQKSNLEAKKLHSWGFFCFILGFVCFFWIFHSFHTVATSPSVQYKLISKLLYSYIIKMNSVVNTHTRLQILIGAHPGKTTQMCFFGCAAPFTTAKLVSIVGPAVHPT